MLTASAFGPFVLDRERGILLRDGQAVPLGQRAFAVLAMLAENQGRAVPKSELIARVWPDTFVEEGNLTVQIAALRKALGETADGQSWIVTVPRVGYRLLSQATGSDNSGDSPPNRPRLAVLPFQVLGQDADQSYFADGVVEDIITALSRFRSFSVVGRSSSFAYPGQGADARRVATELGVRYVLQGSIRRAGDQLRLSAQLVDGASGASLWAKQFDGTLENVFEFQDQITGTVASLIEPRITVAEIERSRRERPGSFAVYDIVLRAQALIATESERDNAEATALLEQGLAAEPENALLLSYAARMLQHRIVMGWPPFGSDDRQRCGELARRALERAGDDSTIMSICGISLLMGAGEYDLGLAAIQAAVEANPNSLLVANRAGVAHLHCGSLEEAMGHFERARKLGPGDPQGYSAFSGTAYTHLLRGEYAEALTCASRSLAMNPNFDPAHWVLIAANARLGHMAEARRCVEDLQRLWPGVTVARIRKGYPTRYPERLELLLEGLCLAGLPDE